MKTLTNILRECGLVVLGMAMCGVVSMLWLLPVAAIAYWASH